MSKKAKIKVVVISALLVACVTGLSLSTEKPHAEHSITEKHEANNENGTKSTETKVHLKVTEKAEPIIPKEVTHGSDNSTGDMVADAGTDTEGDNGNSFGGTFASIGPLPEPEYDSTADADSADYVSGDSEPSETAEQDSGNDEWTPEMDAVADAPDREYIGDWTISFYCNCEICCGQRSGGATASGVMPSAWWTAATGDLPFGTILYVDGLGTFEVQDRGTEYGWLDVFVSDHNEAINLGLQTRPVYIAM